MVDLKKFNEFINLKNNHFSTTVMSCYRIKFNF